MEKGTLIFRIIVKSCVESELVRKPHPILKTPKPFPQKDPYP